MSRYLFIGGHVDEEVCFGGTIIKLVEQGHEVFNIAYSTGTSNDEEWQASSKIMGSTPLRYYLTCHEQYKDQMVADDLYKLRNDYDFIFTHSTFDRHPFHSRIGEQSKRVFNGNLITYIAPWNGNEDPDYFVEITETQLTKKVEALLCYKSQVNRQYMEPDFIRAQARYNGIKCSKLFCEAFKVERLVF